MILLIAVLAGLAGLAGLTWAFAQPVHWEDFWEYYKQILVVVGAFALIVLGVVLTAGVLIGGGW